MTARVLVTGSRGWTNREAINDALFQAYRDLGWPTRVPLLISGRCPMGADRLAETVAASNGLPVELHPADWYRHDDECPPSHRGQRVCKRAGMRRNAEMVAAGADLCLAFIAGASPGASHTAALAEKAGIPTRRYTA